MRLAAACLLLSLPAWGQEPEWRETPVRPGEICLGCNRPIGHGDVTYLVEGQRVAIHRGPCDNSLRANPTSFLARLKPRGGLFGGETAPAGVVTNAWLLAGLYVLAGLCFAAIAAHRALDQGHSPYLWFFIGLIFTAPGYLALLTRRPARAAPVPAGLVKIPTTASPEACPMCGATNHPTAEQCLECGAPLRPEAVSEASRVRPA